MLLYGGVVYMGILREIEIVDIMQNECYRNVCLPYNSNRLSVCYMYTKYKPYDIVLSEILIRESITLMFPSSNMSCTGPQE